MNWGWSWDKTTVVQRAVKWATRSVALTAGSRAARKAVLTAAPKVDY